LCQQTRLEFSSVPLKALGRAKIVGIANSAVITGGAAIERRSVVLVLRKRLKPLFQ
jgi:hypothetical protein